MLLLRNLLVVICGAFIASGAVSGEEVNKAVGDEVSFKLDKIDSSFTSITWKQISKSGTVKAIEWEDKAIDIPNPRFKGITTLDTTTGKITIKNLKFEHSGVYTIDVSGKEQTQRFTLTVMEPVPKPVIKIQPTSNTNVVYLICEYSETIIWKNSAGEILTGSKIEKGESITVEKNGNPDDFYTCTLQNAAGSKTSDPVYERDLFKDESSGGSGWIAIIVILLIILIIGIVCFVLYKRSEAFRELVGKCPCFKGKDTLNASYHQAGNASGVETNRPASQDLQETDRVLVPMPVEIASQEEESWFIRFFNAKTCEDTVKFFKDLCEDLNVEPRDNKHFYSNLKKTIKDCKAKDLWQMIDKRVANKVYEQGKCLVLGAGPCGLKTAIELALMDVQVVVLEKRASFTRNNLVHLWPTSTKDLQDLGAKIFYKNFCNSGIHHISIRQLQLILLKVALILGVEVHTGVTFENLLEPSGTSSNGRDMELKGWRANVSTESIDSKKRLEDFQFDVFISAGGTRCMPDDFKKEKVWEKLAIGITANFVKGQTSNDGDVPKSAGFTQTGWPDFFEKLQIEKGINLENIVYYKGDYTHYFVMTAELGSLIKKKVIKQPCTDSSDSSIVTEGAEAPQPHSRQAEQTQQSFARDSNDVKNLLESANINQNFLQTYALEAAKFYTEKKKYELPNMKFAKNYAGDPDVAIFDFTCLYRAEEACRVMEKKGKKLLIGLVGDSLIEPYWPLGTGIGIGFLSVFDTACMVRDWINRPETSNSDQDVINERERVYKLLCNLCDLRKNSTEDTHYAYFSDFSRRHPNINLSGQVKKAVGDQVSFKLDEIVPRVTSITWKHRSSSGTIKAIEWENGETTTPNQRFKGITTLDTKTGQITITDLTVEHTGVYIIDINGEDLEQRFTLSVMEPVPQPVIKIEKTDNPDVVYLICEYSEKIIWKNSAGETLTGSARRPKGESITVTNKRNSGIFYTCSLQNAVSEKTSDPVYDKDLFNHVVRARE